MTATERLRQLLDERGVEWEEALTDLSRQTHWSTERYWCAFTEWNDAVDIADTLTFYHVSPEQAIAATLGRGTCKVEAHVTDGFTTDHPSNWNLLSCGHWVGMNGFDNPHYCPNCGRRVES